MSDSAFESLRRAQSSPGARERLHEARRELALQDNDALWGLLQVVQDYRASLGPVPAAPTEPSPQSAPPEWAFRPWQLMAAALAGQTAALALAFCIGLYWGRGLPPDTSWLRAWLGVPAGWMVFLLVMPFLLQGAISSWRARKRDGAVGWLLLCAFCGTLLASAASLVWLLY